jgi:AcrR family transcriptional regulator
MKTTVKPGVKERILKTAAELFYFEGYNQTGINQIISEAKVAKASMYQHFRSKQDIAVAYLQERHEMWMNMLFDYVLNKEKGTAQIISCFDFLDAWLNKVDFRGCGFQNIITDLPKEQIKIPEVVYFHKKALKKWIQTNLSQVSDIKPKEVEPLSLEIMVLVEGAIMLSQINKNNAPILAAKRTCEKLFKI